jgi:hypothetical protein
MKIHCLIVVGKQSLTNAMHSISILNKNGILVHVLWREGSKPRSFQIQTETEVEVPKISLSQARNLLLTSMKNCSSLEENDVIFFPDDDGSIPDHFGDNVMLVFADYRIKWALGCYLPIDQKLDTRRFPQIQVRRCSRKEILKISSSHGLYVRYGVLKSVGFFDENLGVGARIGVGEDTEMALRLRGFTGESPYFPILVQHHPYKPGKYSPTEKFQFLAYLSVRDFNMYFSLFRYTVRIIMLERLNFKLCVKLYLVEFKYWKYAKN